MNRLLAYWPMYFGLIFAFLFPMDAVAQLHLKTGYSIGFSNLEQTNELLNAYNQANPWLDDPFGDQQWWHGLHIGARYRLDFVSIEAGWTMNFGKTLAEGLHPTTDADFSKKMIFNYHIYSAGLENLVGNIGFGATLNYNRMVVKSRVKGESKLEVLNSDHLSGTVFLGLYTNHRGGITLGLRPYVQVPITGYDLGGLADDLELSGDYEESSPWVFGIRLLFFNGY